MVLEDLQDPGNVGTIIRTGEGAGISLNPQKASARVNPQKASARNK